MIAPPLARRDGDLRELMDDPHCDAIRLRRTLERFALINRLVAGWGGVYRRHIRPRLIARGGGEARILDIGCGAGDVLRGIVSRARADGFAVTGLGLDPDDRSLSVARGAASMRGVEYMLGHSGDLAARGDAFDVVVSNHLLHHLSRSELAAVLADSRVLSRGVSLHSDIHRSALAYAGYAIGVTPLAPGSFLRTDGLRSIRRSYTAFELEGVLPEGWRVERPAAFRLLAVSETGH
ncbi:methyltransferase domain-containing protein [Microbacterium sp. NPDC078428]|uniref:methyltransferase domain-containing protein n=1 Tax=Microbacterium sp. NPDC078428 TaxID=3364190 RepID=UPI0037C87D09